LKIHLFLLKNGIIHSKYEVEIKSYSINRIQDGILTTVIKFIGAPLKFIDSEWNYYSPRLFRLVISNNCLVIVSLNHFYNIGIIDKKLSYGFNLL
jgi:hypothetical protein